MPCAHDKEALRRSRYYIILLSTRYLLTSRGTFTDPNGWVGTDTELTAASCYKWNQLRDPVRMWALGVASVPDHSESHMYRYWIVTNIMYFLGTPTEDRRHDLRDKVTTDASWVRDRPGNVRKILRGYSYFQHMIVRELRQSYDSKGLMCQRVRAKCGFPSPQSDRTHHQPITSRQPGLHPSAVKDENGSTLSSTLLNSPEGENRSSGNCTPRCKAASPYHRWSPHPSDSILMTHPAQAALPFPRP